MKRITALALCFITAATGEALSDVPVNKPTEIALATVETFCLPFARDLSRASARLDAIGKKIDPQMSAAILAPQKGTTWFLNTNGQRLMVGLTETGVCQVMSELAKGTEFVRLAETIWSARLQRTEKIGSQVEHWYTLKFQDADSYVDEQLVLMVTSSTLASVPGIIVNVLLRPESN